MKRCAWLVLACGSWVFTAPARGDDLKDLTRQLKDPDVKIKKEAAASLGKLGKPAMPVLMTYLKDKDRDNRALALIGLAEVGPVAAETKDLYSILFKMMYTSPTERAAIALALGKIGKPSVEPLVNFLNGQKDPELRRFALEALGHAGPAAKDAANDIVTALKDQSPVVRTAGVDALGKIGKEAKGAIPVLKFVARADKDNNVRIRTAMAMAHIDGDDAATAAAVDALLGNEDKGKSNADAVAKFEKEGIHFYQVALRSKDQVVRFNALQALPAVKGLNEDIVPDLAKTVGDEMPGVRKATLVVLSRLGPAAKDAAPQLAQAVLSDKKDDVRKQSFDILMRLGHKNLKEAVPTLALVIKEREEYREPLLDVMIQLGPDARPAVPALIALHKELKDEKDEKLKKKMQDKVDLALVKIGKAAVPAMADTLRDPDPKVRLFVLEFLTKLGPDGEMAASAVMKNLKDKDEEVRRKATEFLKTHGKDLVAINRENLKDKDLSIRLTAIDLLGEMGAQAEPAIPDLRALLMDNDATIRIHSMQTLKDIGPEAKVAIPDIAKRLSDKEKEVRRAAAEVLQKFGADAIPATSALAQMLNNDPEAANRRQAALALGEIGQAAANVVPDLIVSMKKEKDTDVRKTVIQMLGQMGPPAKLAVPELLKLLKDKDKEITQAAVASLSLIGPGAIATFTAALKDPDKDMRRNVALVLLNMGPKAKEALPALVAGLKDPEEEIRKLCILSLKEIGAEAKAYVSQVAGALKDENAEVRANAAYTLLQMGPEAKAAIPGLVKNLKDPEQPVRDAASSVLAELAPDAVVPALIESLKDKDKLGRVTAAETLGRMGPKARNAVQALMNLLGDPMDEVRAAANRALENIRQ